MKFAAALAVSFAILAAPVAAQTAPDWRTIEPQNLLVIDTVHGRILVELDSRVAPLSVERIRTLADRGFYDGLKFHRVIADFMVQTGDPQGTGQGGSDLPDVNAEFQFRRGRDAGFAPVQPTPQGQAGVMGSMAVVTQPDAQMMVTADFKAGAQALFCKGVAGMARNGADVNSANSQFFLMRADREDLNGQYTPFGRVVVGMDAVEAIKVGQGPNGQVVDPDVMTRVRTASAMPEGQRPAVRVMNTASPAFTAFVERTKTTRGAAFNICDAQPPAELIGG
ncbi:peptidylprolyl isomerase [Brevundimonas sp. NPDC092305]|uniref:peptidylprolyl isomerase n=1 Tax=Brevundimonas sp. NPDC092305 TaxID=3363957 RepID=UPI00380C83E6